jgi:polyphosphate kinase
MAKSLKKYISRELSWLSFNHRVLQEAQDPSVPLIERIRFLGIFSNNLDEFFKVRVATIKRMIDFEEGKKIEGEDPKKLMNAIQKQVIHLQNIFENTYQHILGLLESENIFIINEKELNPSQEIFVKKYFQEQVLPFLSPIMLHNVDEFPELRDKSIYLATKLTSTITNQPAEYALIEIPTAVLPRFITLPHESERVFIILLEDIIRYSLNEVFATFDYDNFEAWTIKLTRDAELDLDNDLTQSFLEKIQKGIKGRSKGQPVRFVFDNSLAKDLLEYITNMLNLDTSDTLIPGSRYHNFKDFMKFPGIGGAHLVYPKDAPIEHPFIKPHKSVLKLIAEKDLLLHVPFQGFNDFINLLREAAIDPYVQEIKITLYRVAQNSRVINALINAARNGKQVTAIIELQARFDEKSNIYWSGKLEDAGVKIVFGIPSLKVHSKLVLITRKEKGRNVYYTCVATGNFHEGNATVYTDLILMTADKRISNEVYKVFDFFENTYKSYQYSHLLVAPLNMRKKLYKHIDEEIKNATAGKPAYIILKINNMVDKDIINKLYQASSSGVKIKLIIRGTCSLLPGIPGLSENIEAISIVDKYLEHSRIFIFCNKGKELYYISSADWMPRNLDRRIEVAAPIYDKALQKEIRDIIDIQLKDNVKARILNSLQDNPYIPKKDNEPKFRSQIETTKYYKKMLQK